MKFIFYQETKETEDWKLSVEISERILFHYGKYPLNSKQLHGRMSGLREVHFSFVILFYYLLFSFAKNDTTQYYTLNKIIFVKKSKRIVFFFHFDSKDWKRFFIRISLVSSLK